MKKTLIKIIEAGGQMSNSKKQSGKFSVIIRTKNEEKWIGHTIQSVIDNIKKPQIIIVDNKSEDRTLHIVKQFIEDPKLKDTSDLYTDIKITIVDEYSPVKSLNIGVKNAKYENVFFISAHCVLNKFNSKKMIKNLNSFKAIFGKQIPIWEGKKISKRYIWSHFVDKEVINMYSKFEKRYFFHNAASIFKKSFLKKFPFDENLTGKEDRYWVKNIIKKGYSYLYDPSFEVFHHYTPEGNTWKGLG